MPYASKLDLENTYGVENVAVLADHDGDGVPEEEAIDEALESASSIIDSHLGARYSVPIGNPPPIMRDLCIDIAWYRLAYSRLKQTAEMRLRYEDAIKLLTRISDGKASIGLDDGGTVGGGDGTGDGTSDDQSGSLVGRTRWLERA
jgi:phage gp36-like protein